MLRTAIIRRAILFLPPLLSSTILLSTNVWGAPETPKSVKIGVATVLSGDLAVLGQNVVATTETYKKHYARHALDFIYEDARLSSTDGLRAFQKLINTDGASLIIAGCTSNGTMAAKALINSSSTPTLTIVTGGHNVDQAGPYIFRIGNSDTLNGIQEAQAFIKAGVKNVAMLTEETEYTQDIANFFRPEFKKLGGQIVFDQNFLPAASDFRTEIALIKKAAPQGILIPTQTGTALGLFVKQWHALGGDKDMPIHTTFVAAPNPDAHAIAGDLLNGIYYMNPDYDRESARMKEFLGFYKADHNQEPPIPFHSAGIVDVLDLLQAFLDTKAPYTHEGFAKFLLEHVKNYHGLMGTYSFDEEGNGNIGFSLARIGAAAMTR